VEKSEAWLARQPILDTELTFVALEDDKKNQELDTLS
jgi:hypothetical protein